MKTNTVFPDIPVPRAALRAAACIIAIFAGAIKGLAAPPVIDHVVPHAAVAGGQLIIRGANFDCDRTGGLWNGHIPPYKVAFANSSGILLPVDCTFVNSSMLVVTVPDWARGGRVHLHQSSGSPQVFASSPDQITVAQPAVRRTSLRIWNNTAHHLVSVIMNGTPLMTSSQTVAPLGEFFLECPVDFTDTITVELGWGTYGDATTPRPGKHVVYRISRKVDMLSRRLSVLTITPLAMGRMMARLAASTSSSWVSDTYYDSRGLPHRLRLSADLTNIWRLKDEMTGAVANGTAVLSAYFEVSDTVQIPPNFVFQMSNGMRGWFMPVSAGVLTDLASPDVIWLNPGNDEAFIFLHRE